MLCEIFPTATKVKEDISQSPEMADTEVNFGEMLQRLSGRSGSRNAADDKKNLRMDSDKPESMQDDVQLENAVEDEERALVESSQSDEGFTMQDSDECSDGGGMSLNTFVPVDVEQAPDLEIEKSVSLDDVEGEDESTVFAGLAGFQMMVSKPDKGAGDKFVVIEGDEAVSDEPVELDVKAGDDSDVVKSEAGNDKPSGSLEFGFFKQGVDGSSDEMHNADVSEARTAPVQQEMNLAPMGEEKAVKKVDVKPVEISESTKKSDFAEVVIAGARAVTEANSREGSDSSLLAKDLDVTPVDAGGEQAADRKATNVSKAVSGKIGLAPSRVDGVDIPKENVVSVAGHTKVANSEKVQEFVNVEGVDKQAILGAVEVVQDQDKSKKTADNQAIAQEKVVAQENAIIAGAKFNTAMQGGASDLENRFRKDMEKFSRQLETRHNQDGIEGGQGIKHGGMQGKLDSMAELMKSASASGKAFESVMNKAERLQDVIDGFDKYILSAVGRKDNSITISLVPKNLGEITINCKESGGEMALEIVAANKGVRGVLSNHESFIREAVENSGFKLTQFDVRTRNENMGQERFQRGGSEGGRAPYAGVNGVVEEDEVKGMTPDGVTGWNGEYNGLWLVA